MNLFDNLEEKNKQIPLAEIMRPKSLEEYFGQEGVINKNTPIYNLLLQKRLFSIILYGPPGVGKTTLARLIAKNNGANFIELSAVTSGVKDVKEAVEKAKRSMPVEEELCDLAELYKVFGDSTRIKILNGLFDGEMCVCDIALLLGMTLSAISHQLRILKSAKLVKFRREGKTIFYSLSDKHVHDIIGLGLEHIRE